MSSILEGLYNEQDQPMDHAVAQRQEYISDLRRKLEKVESILGRSTDRNGKQFNQAIQDITKNIKYLEQDELVFEIYSKMRGMAEAIGMDVAEGSPYDDEEDAVREAFNNLEAVVYNMEEPFEDYVRGLQTEVEELELDEGMYDQEAFNKIFGADSKDRAKKREKPKSKPKDTGMYNQPNKADKDKEGEQLTEAQFDEAAGEKDACYHKVKSRYKVWPSAYASGALVKCRKVGASNWGKTTTKEDEDIEEGFPDFSRINPYNDHNDRNCSLCKGSGYPENYEYMKSLHHTYIQKPEPKCPRCKGTGKKAAHLHSMPDEEIDEADGSGSYGGQSPLTYDTQRSSKMKEEDDELNEITKLSGLGEARKKRPDAYDDDWDNEDEDEKVEDPDKDKVPHILMQLKKALDVDGDYPIKFLDGSAYKLPVDNINDFIDTYMLLKPTDRENLQIVAVRSKKEFDNIILLINQSTKKK